MNTVKESPLENHIQAHENEKLLGKNKENLSKGKLYLINLIGDWQIPLNLNYLGILWIKNIFFQLLTDNTEVNHLPQTNNKI